MGRTGIGGRKTGHGRARGYLSLLMLGALVLLAGKAYRLEREAAFSAGKVQGEGLVRDPAYETYRVRQDFYTEHPYLLPDWDENTAAESAEQTESVRVTEPGEMMAETSGEMYLMAQLKDYDFLMRHFYNVHPSTTAGRDMMNADNFIHKDFSVQKDAKGPQILIYHTHSQEEYADYAAGNGEAFVTTVGEVLAENLRAKGYQVLHDVSAYDIQGGELDRNLAYQYALEGITEILERNPQIQVILDIHRDGVKENVHLVSEVNGAATAQIMFFNGLSQTPDGPIEYLPNEYRDDNLAFSFQAQLLAEQYYPGLTRKIYLKGLRYNQHLRPRTMLVEVGAQTNTLEEAVNAMGPFAEVLDMVLQGQ